MLYLVLKLLSLLVGAATAVRESSMVGESEFDRECRRWWRKVVCCTFLIVAGIAGVAFLVFKNRYL